MKKIISITSILILCIFLMADFSEAQVKPGWPKSVTIGAAAVGSTYFIWMGGLIKIIHDKLGITGRVETTGGPIHNAQLLELKQVEFGGVTAGPAYEGWYGSGWAKGKKHQNLRVLIPMYTSYFHVYALKKSGIKSLNDLNGKSVGLSTIGTTPALYFPEVFKVGGIKPSRIANASSEDLGSQVKDGMLDANGQSVGLPWPTIAEVETTHDINIFGVPKEIATKFMEQFPFFSPGTIPKGTYKSNKDYDIPTITIWSFILTHKDMPEDFIYEVVKKIYENVDILIATHRSAREVKPEFIVNSTIPLHPGAIRYYKEIGIKIPEKIIP